VEEVDAAELRSRGRLRLEVEVDDAARAELVLRGELGLGQIERRDGRLLAIGDAGARPESIARALVGAGLALSRLAPVREDLEEHFMRLTGGEI